MTVWLTVIGIGEDGLAGLGEAARDALGAARVVFGGQRHLAMLPDSVLAERHPWPSPFTDGLKALLARRGQPVCVLASGDPMLFGVGATLSREVPAAEMRVLPAPSAFSLAAARLGWALQEVAQVSIHGRALELVHPHLHHGARLLVLAHDGSSPAALAALLRARGFGDSRLVVLEHLGGALERRVETTAAAWREDDAVAPLNVIAVQCRADAGVRPMSLLAGLPDAAYRHDGQLTKRDVRAVTLAHLGPCPGELLWDVGAGCGSISIEWMRAHPSCRAIAIEENAGRQGLIRANAAALGVPGLQLVAGSAPGALAGLAEPDAIFIGGGVTEAGLLEACWAALRPGGRLVANAVTLQSETLLVAWRQRLGGDLIRLAVSHAAPLGSFDAWRGALPVTLLSVAKDL
ncbi:precorrin-6Y C5,15-methyltransferase (decarboxylating) [Dongia mobilis]|uniref:Precorrin-6Y C5,15-methyltransferase (Decarboxylating) n=1 Tax=Dongia mobilis TaxID=578943 RepID=A0A4R6WVU8_9PROT|nr:precorrin-6y C5,15-methyltransferase (decarboxylating) subunit CbiE [Dongia mobilis]TDQ84589.1 precorrin-6Y C5,15-methyltransferase (decarboxylating) [Dongia mobilis]